MTGVTSPANGTLTAGTATVQFGSRYGYAQVTNGGKTPWYVRADGQVPASPFSNCYVVQPGTMIMVPNGAMLWYPGLTGPDGTAVANPGMAVAIVASDTTTDASAPYEVVAV
jgi:hypothetical protein